MPLYETILNKLKETLFHYFIYFCLPHDFLYQGNTIFPANQYGL